LQWSLPVIPLSLSRRVLGLDEIPSCIPEALWILNVITVVMNIFAACRSILTLYFMDFDV
jgi:hypothetical protein